MIATELKIGDIVNFGGEKAKLIGISFEDENSITVQCLEDGSENRIWRASLLDEIDGIPLTKEILEKNRWQWDEDDWVFFCEFCPNVYLAPVGNGFSVVDATGEQLGRINAAVHELQHLLWALGIKDDLKI